MAGQPDPAFLNNVATAIVSTLASLSTGITTSQISSSTTSILLISSILTSTLQTAASEATGTTTPSDNGSIYFYTPSTAVAIVFSVLYAVLIPYHFYLSIYTPYIRKSVSQKHGYTIPLFVTCVLSTVGFGLRTVSSSPSNRSSLSLYAISQTFIIIAPIFACATLYQLIAHLVKLCLPAGMDRSFFGMSPRWLGRAFIISDVVSFLMQGLGSGITASGDWEGAKKDIGTNILIIGLAVQLVTSTLYMIVIALFCFRVKAGHGSHNVRDHGTTGQRGSFPQPATDKRDFGFNPLVKQVMKGIWIASVFMEIRSVYRTIEFGMGTDRYLFHHEWCLWLLDAAPIWIALIVLGYYHPVLWLQSKRRSFFVEKIVGHTTQQAE